MLKILQFFSLAVGFAGIVITLFNLIIGLFVVAFALILQTIVMFYTLTLTDFHEVLHKAKKGKVLAIIIGEDKKIRFKAMRYLRGWVWDEDEKGHFGYILFPDNVYIYKGVPVAVFYRSHINSLNAKVLANLTVLEKYDAKPFAIKDGMFVPVDNELLITKDKQAMEVKIDENVIQ